MDLRYCCVLFILGCLISCNKDNLIISVDEVKVYKPNNTIYSLLINTPNGIAITSKDLYVDSSSFILSERDLVNYSGFVSIKGRGNSTWAAPKKPYAIKLQKKASLASLPEEKSWVLLANHYDPTKLRNDVAFFIGNRLSVLEYTPRFCFVNMSINGSFQGIYQLGEKIKKSTDRVNIGENGFLLEFDDKYSSDDAIFRTDSLVYPINIKYPEIKEGSEEYLYIKDYVNKAEESLFSDSFLNESTGYHNYFDLNSFVDWYLINELTKNADGILYTSCYMYLFERGGQFKMGPLWDFDLAFGNYIYGTDSIKNEINSTEGFWVKNSPWFKRFFQDPSFVGLLKKRFDHVYSNRFLIYDFIETRSSLISPFIIEDNRIWESLCIKESSDDEVLNEYNIQIKRLKSWIEARFQWLKESLSAME